MRQVVLKYVTDALTNVDYFAREVTISGTGNESVYVMANYRAHYEGTELEIWERQEANYMLLLQLQGQNLFDIVTEGIWINKLTENFNMARLDGAFRGNDIKVVEMPRFLLKNDGLFGGSSSIMNCIGSVRVAKFLGLGHTIVTILCDSGMV
ncbi:unnamed protein product [Lactuca saligna]|uniref:Uncharacterized protein n=1 Tax=Lactuca saligna TaxID=75948 RepID=A0AA35Z1N8_LACSI|nr:unnamed protein product [Lactuca saligna]